MNSKRYNIQIRSHTSLWKYKCTKMEKERLETLLIDYIDGKLNDAEQQAIEQKLVSDADAFKMYEQLKEVINAIQASAKIEPSSRLKRGFEQMLREEELELGKNKGRVVLFQPSFYGIAATIAFFGSPSNFLFI